MKFCQKCGKEIMDEAVICPNCGCATAEKAVKTKEPSYDECVKGAATTDIIAVIILAVGILCSLFVNVWLGVGLLLVTEFVAISPNTKLQKAVKNNNSSLGKKEIKEKTKRYKKDLKSKYPSFKISFVLAFIALVCLIVFLFWGSALGVI